MLSLPTIRSTTCSTSAAITSLPASIEPPGPGPSRPGPRSPAWPLWHSGQCALPVPHASSRPEPIKLTVPAVMLKPGHRQPWLPFRLFNRAFEAVTAGFTGGVRFFLRHAVIALTLVAGMLGATWWLFGRVPGGLVPNEDQGYVFLVTQLPPAASLDRTLAITANVSEGAGQNPAVANVVTLAGFDFLSGAQKTNSGVSFVTLKDWSERTDPRQDARALAPAFGALNARFRDGVVIGFNRRRSGASAPRAASNSTCKTAPAVAWKACRKLRKKSFRPP